VLSELSCQNPRTTPCVEPDKFADELKLAAIGGEVRELVHIKRSCALPCAVLVRFDLLRFVQSHVAPTLRGSCSDLPFPQISGPFDIGK
jgi:hypothetical protein